MGTLSTTNGNQVTGEHVSILGGMSWTSLVAEMFIKLAGKDKRYQGLTTCAPGEVGAEKHNFLNKIKESKTREIEKK